MPGTHDSYDVFDTIIGRICYKGTEIFDIMEKITGIYNFKQIRMACETVGIENIYSNMKSQYGITRNDLANLELELEYDFSFPILKYLNAIKDNDILISDMYLSQEQICHLIAKHRHIDNPLYVSSGGKSSGYIWKSDIVKDISMHYGDNYISDYTNARTAGISSTHISNIELTPIETTLASICKEAAYIIRAVRLTTQTDTHFMNKVLHNLMLPIGTLIAYWIKSHVDSFEPTKIVFLSRDGYWLKCIFDALFPNNPTEYLYFSRIMAQNHAASTPFIDHCKDKTIFIDLFGTGNTFNTYIGPRLSSYRYLLPFAWKVTPLSHSYILCPTTVSAFHEFISVEDIFSAPHGSVINEQTLLHPEYDINQLKSYMDGVKYYIKYSNIYNKYISLDKQIPESIIREAIYSIVTYSNSGEYNSINTILGPHLNCHSYNDRQYPLQYYSQIGQDKHYIEQIVRFKPFGTFIEIGGYDGITGSNTYFLEKYLGWHGAIVECLPHLAEKCRSVRTASVYQNAVYKESNKMIDITVPTGAEIDGGKEQLSGIKDYMRPNSLTYFSKSYAESDIISVPTITINDIFEKEAMMVIDYMSIDIEGYELEALKTIDYDKYKIKFITIEHGNASEYQSNINSFMLSKGYKLHRNNMWDDEYILENE